MSFSARWPVCFALPLFATCLSMHAQVTAAAGLAPGRVSQKTETVPRVPGVSGLFDGFDAGVTYSAVHDSAAGWYTVATPAVSYAFSQHFSTDASTSVYFHHQVRNTNASTVAAKPLINDPLDAGDTLIGFHGIFEPGALQETITGSLTAPTGNRSHGLGTGRVTVDFSNHLEHYYKKTGFLVDVGGGDSSGLFNDLVAKNYNSLGWLVHFQSGMVFWLPGHAYIESVAYEQLPLGSQKVYRTVKRGYDDVRTAVEDGPAPPPTPVPTVFKVNEDNGFTTFVGIPLANYISLSGYYNRSLRQHLDTVSFGVTYVVRGNPKKRLSMIDRALREAEGANP